MFCMFESMRFDNSAKHWTKHCIRGGNAVAEKQVDFACNGDGQLTSISRYLGGQSVADTDYSYDFLGRLTGINHHQGDNTLAFYNFAYGQGSGGGLSLGGTGFASVLGVGCVQRTVSGAYNLPSGFNGLGGVPTASYSLSGRPVLPFHDTGAIDQSSLGQSIPSAARITGVSSIDGTASYTYDALGQLTGANYTGEGAQDGEFYS
jgi:YD repeat-containing protein